MEKKKIKITPQEFGCSLGKVFTSMWLERISKDVLTYGDKISDLTEVEKERLWSIFLMIHCAAFNVGVDSSELESFQKQEIIDFFWNIVLEDSSASVSASTINEIKSNYDSWYPKIKSLINDPSTNNMPSGNLGPGKLLFKMVFPTRELKDNVLAILEMTYYFIATFIPLSDLAVNSINDSEFV